jgi:hypothetical protein
VSQLLCTVHHIVDGVFDLLRTQNTQTIESCGSSCSRCTSLSSRSTADRSTRWRQANKLRPKTVRVRVVDRITLHVLVEIRAAPFERIGSFAVHRPVTAS